MACTPDSIAAEGAWAPLGWGSRHAGVGAPFFVSSNRNVLVLLCCRSVGLGDLEV